MKKWTPYEIDFLFAYYSKLGVAKTAETLGRPEHAIRNKSSQLKIKGRRLVISEKHRGETKKRCSVCEITKSLDLFSKSKRNSHNRNAWCKSCINSYARKRNKDPIVQQKAKDSHRKARIEIMKHYCKDGVIECACCGENEIKFMCIDHIYGGGNQHRKSIGSSPLHWWLKKNNYPSGFQILCYNCNMAKGFYGSCPHNDVT